MKKLVILLLCAVTMSSCATIFCGSKKRVTFDSNIKETATLTVDGKKYADITFPYTVKVKRGFDDTLVKAEMKDYTAEPITIEKTFNAVSVLNLVDILAWGIDAATGAMMKPEFTNYEFEFKPKVLKE